MGSTSIMISNKRRTRCPNWSSLDTDLLLLILYNLSFNDILRFKDCCSFWNFAAKSRYLLVSSPPWLMLPASRDSKPRDECHHHHDQGCRIAATTCCRFFSLARKETHESCDDFAENLCVGSSRGWLVILDNRASPLLLKPFSRQKNRAPTAQNAQPGDTQLGKGNTWVVIIHGSVSENLAYCNVRDESWSGLNGDHLSYCDILSHEGRLYALSSSSTVEVWDFDQSSSDCYYHNNNNNNNNNNKNIKYGSSFPTKVMNLVPKSQPCLGLDGHYVNSQGDLLDEGELLTDKDAHPLVCPYRTVAFRVHKMELRKGVRCMKWEKVESLGGRVLFLRGNDSSSSRAFPGSSCDKNSIYFTDDNWDDMNVDYLYGGHDNGVYSLETKAFKPYFQFDDDKVDPPPFWIVTSL
ncbi:F-box domain containing protein [Parasponia andersonii]|uniref:F-box domain containing protein n=1 Tax=Parasponia andersonii TaxID=3476 RepID=A0A2P5AI68_PARAD|nr:F-box domain containing protein [Parasponia andersonii]